MRYKGGSRRFAKRVNTTVVASTPFTLVSSRETSGTAAGESRTGVSALWFLFFFFFFFFLQSIIIVCVCVCVCVCVYVCVSTHTHTYTHTHFNFNFKNYF
jgi:hypothetical protein